MQLASPSYDSDTARGVTIRHNLANALHRQGKIEEAKTINDELLAWYNNDRGKAVVPRRVYLIMMNLKADIITHCVEDNRSTPYVMQEERLQLCMSVYNESRELLGMGDIDTWIAVNNVLGSLVSLNRYSELGSIIQENLKKVIPAQQKVEGAFARTLALTYDFAMVFLNHLQNSAGLGEAITQEFQQLLTIWARQPSATSQKLSS